MVSRYVPDRGDVIWATLDPTLGHEQKGRRPVLVLTNARYNGLTDLAVVCPISRQKKGYIFEVALTPGPNLQGVVLADQVKSLDWRQRNVELITQVPHAVLKEVQRHVVKLLEIEPEP